MLHALSYYNEHRGWLGACFVFGSLELKPWKMYYRKFKSCGILRRVDLIVTDVSEYSSASVSSVKQSKHSKLSVFTSRHNVTIHNIWIFYKAILKMNDSSVFTVLSVMPFEAWQNTAELVGRPTATCDFAVSFHVVCNSWAGIAHSVWRLAVGWTVRGSNPSWDGMFWHLSRQVLGPTQLLFRGKRSRGVALTTHPHLTPPT